jgi:bifunctional ADP-heptose synthase (sugar kinase/adenylyltransferase)
LVSSRTGRQGPSVTSEEARTDCIAILSRIDCVVIIKEPTPIHSIAYIHYPTTPQVYTDHFSNSEIVNNTLLLFRSSFLSCSETNAVAFL